MRPITQADGEELSAGLAGLSDRSIYLRFHTVRSRGFSTDERRYLTDIDHRTHCAWIVEQAGRGVAVGRYISTPADPRSAELSLVVTDGMQHRGVSKCLLAILYLAARRNGLVTFTASVLHDNADARQSLARLGFKSSPQCVERGSDLLSGSAEMDKLPLSLSGNAIRDLAELMGKQLREGSSR